MKKLYKKPTIKKTKWDNIQVKEETKLALKIEAVTRKIKLKDLTEKICKDWLKKRR